MLGDRRAVDLRRRQQRPALRRDAPDAATRLVAARIANRVLHVTDERIEPVDHVERAVGSELHADRPEVRVGGLQQRLHFDADETGALLDGLVLLDAEEPDDVVVEEVALRGLGEVAALDEFAAARGPHACQRPLLHRLLLVRVIDVAGERRAPVVVAIGGIGHEVLAPRVDHVSPRVGEGVRHEHVQLLRARLVAPHAGVREAPRTVRRFDLRVQERALLEVERAVRAPLPGVDRVVAVLGAEAMQEDPALVGLAVAVGVLHEHQRRLLRDVHAAVAEREPRRDVEVVGKDRALVGLAVAIGVLEHDQLVVRLLVRQHMRVGR